MGIHLLKLLYFDHLRCCVNQLGHIILEKFLIFLENGQYNVRKLRSEPFYLFGHLFFEEFHRFLFHLLHHGGSEGSRVRCDFCEFASDLFCCFLGVG
jgi:hypothetical protein